MWGTIEERLRAQVRKPGAPGLARHTREEGARGTPSILRSAAAARRGPIRSAQRVASRAWIAWAACRPSIARRKRSFASGVMLVENVSRFIEQSEPHIVHTPFS